MKKTPKSIRTTFTLLVGLASWHSIAQAQINWDGGDSTELWSTNTNWVGDVVPGAADTARIGHPFNSNPATATYDAGTTTVTGLIVGQGFGGAATGTLNITGGTLTSNTLTMGQYDSSEGTLNINGGTLDLAITQNNFIGTSGTASIHVLDGFLIGASQARLWLGNSGTGSIDISGGRIGTADGTGYGVTVYMDQLGATGTANFTINGSSGAMNMDTFRINGSTGTATINMNADSGGISTLYAAAISTEGAGTQNLNIDLTNYDISNGTSIKLFDSDFASIPSDLNDVFDSIVITGGTGTFTVSTEGSGSIVTLESITVASSDPFDDWATDKGSPGIDFDSNSDGDAVSAGGEWYFLDSDPGAADAFGLSVFSSLDASSAASGSFTYEHDRPKDRTGITETYQWTTSLTTGWTDSGASDGTNTVTVLPSTTGVPANGNATDYESVVITVTTTVGPTPITIFSRVVITKP